MNPEYAFPCPMSEQTHSNQDCAPFQNGMSLRDYFAAQALSAVYVEACKEMDKTGYPEHWKTGVAVDAYAMADAMLVERAKGGEE